MQNDDFKELYNFFLEWDFTIVARRMTEIRYHDDSYIFHINETMTHIDTNYRRVFISSFYSIFAQNNAKHWKKNVFLIKSIFAK